MKLWTAYQSFIHSQVQVTGAQWNLLESWRRKLFAESIIYLIPFSILSLIPTLYYTYETGDPIRLHYNLATILVLLFVGFVAKLSVRLRKIIFFVFIFFVSFSLTILIGNTGPGVLYLLASIIYATILLPKKIVIYANLANLVFFVSVALLMIAEISFFQSKNFYTLSEWIKIGTNCVLLGSTFSMIFPKLIQDLGTSMENELSLQKESKKKNIVLESTLLQLKNKNRDLELLSRTTSYDLQEPLRTMHNLLEQLRKKFGGKLDPTEQKYIEFAIHESKKMKYILNALLEYSCLEFHLFEKKEKVDLEAIVQDVQMDLRKLIQSESAKILYESLPEVFSSHSALYMVLRNLILNSIQYRKEDVQPIILIGAEEKDNKYIISIQDNGTGIRETKFHRIFNLFDRLDIDHSVMGAGMGLPITKKIISMIGESIWLKSEMNIGSTFFFTVKKGDI